MMDERRFAVKGDSIYDTIFGCLNIRFESKSDAELCCKFLNKLHKEHRETILKLDEILNWHNEQYGKSVLDERMNFKSDCEKENEELKQRLTIHKEDALETLDDLQRARENNRKALQRIEELEKENGQLKNKIDVLEDDNETYHKSLELLQLYTKRFIPTKCTNEFKDCKTNRYYWLDHEGTVHGALEVLNLLDCENELLKSENQQLKIRIMEYGQIKGDVDD